MGSLSLVAFILVGLYVILCNTLLIFLFVVIRRLTETNKQLLIVVAGKDEKPEALRALVASNKPPQKVIPGIANRKKKDKPENTDYVMEIGVH